MDTGRELDQMIARHVFDWSADWLGHVKAGWEPGVSVPRYSTDLAVAWTVVERLRELGWLGELNWHDLNNAVTYCATFFRCDRRQDAIGYGASPAEAVCIAALAACGVEVPA